ncbi:hypothetical protein [Halospeciosus flavus]|uniref:ATP-NAD kinase n=1 Tax=Halospeciosus flavus TaxID=3032283 RepID=A0ABD5Z4U5_9EURY|nr:hypothetical protein [Halospeciosus flavus]
MTNFTPQEVGVVGEGRDETADLVMQRGLDATAGSVADVLDADPDVVVALGESALFDVVAAGATVPLLPVDAGRGVGGITSESLSDALEAIESAAFDVVELPTLAVETDGEEHRALTDAMLVTARPAHISEFGIHARGRDGERRTVDTVRADGVLVSTPAGGPEYADAVDAPRLGAGVDAVSVAPVAPFRIDRTDWVLGLPTTFTIEREETAVTLLVDDEDVGLVDTDAEVTVERGEPVPVVQVPASRPLFGEE